ncbi:tryptophan--tRNA ligase [Candidatus Peregrinibacteria bacterium CG10_big_fil_rev_8_21_14_0_10_54_7]|nr:MAG: tryptophan--tRNA ligase [Candidatus Peregrinibacteria bacterium CG10_big_fil_rev_8_21_14_0_10_54_7]
MRVLSAMQPSGQLHLGNYFGSMKPNLDFLAQSEDSYFFIADLHALTSVQDPALLRQYREDAILGYLAAGFDPKKAVIFYQSEVPEHTELLWILSTVSPVGLLERAVSYKEKVEKGISASVGLFAYPVLQAADILLYGADKVPVGKDQKQHVEMARDIAIKFNNQFGDVLTVPEPVIGEDVAVVPGIDGQKMSKSYGNTIPLFGEEKEVKKAIMGIVTDSKEKDDPKDPETCIIYQIHRLMLGKKEALALAKEYRSGLPYGEAKKKLFQSYMEFFGPMRQRREAISLKEARHVLDEGAKKARSAAQKTMEEVRRAVGLR